MPNKKRKINIFFSAIKYFSVITKLLVILATLFCFFYIYFSVEELKNREIKEITTASIIIKRTFSSNISYARYQLHYAAKQISKTGGNKQKINQILSSYKTNINNDFDLVTTWNMFSWIGTDGKLSVDGFENILKKPIDLHKRDYLPISKQNPGKIIFGKPVRGAISDRLIIPIAIGVLDEKNNYIGTIVFGIDVGKLAAQLEISVKDNTSQFLIIGGNKEIVFRSSFLDEYKTQSILNALPNNPNFDSEDKVYNLENSLFAKINKIPEINNEVSSLYLTVINNNKTFSREIQNLIIQKLLICLAIAMFVALLLAKIYYRIVRPVAILCEYADNITRQKHNTILFEDLGAQEFEGLYQALSSIQNHFEIEQSLKKQLKFANQAKTSLLKSISHDLRNYISGIYGLANIIADESDKSEEKSQRDKNYINLISAQALEMLDYVQDLLDIEKAESGIIQLHKFENCDVKEFLKKILLFNQHFADEHQVKIKIDFEENLPPLRCDKRRFKEILDNLITNSVKYSKKGSEVKIKVNYLADSEQIYIEISDQGIGMSPEEIERALEGDGKNIDKSGLDQIIDSHGIGLPLVKQMVSLHNAKMEIESKKGFGTKCKLWFLANGLDSNQDKKTIDYNKAINTVLIADDEEVIRTILKHQLEKHGYKVIAAKNPQEILQILDEQTCDLILMDNKMLGLDDGIKTVKIIRKGEVFKNFTNYKTIPIIALSGNCDEQSKAEAMAAGMNGYLEKPFDIKKFLEIAAR